MTTGIPSVQTRAPFNDQVAEAITAHCHIAPEKLIVLENSAKYAPGGVSHKEDATEEDQSLSAIFDTVANINHMALESSTLCCGPSGGPSFHDALFRSSDELMKFAAGRPIRYIELGPEPWKSRAILSRLIAKGADLHQYIGIDINPKSEEPMFRILAPVIGEDRFTYWNQDFYKASAGDFPKPKTSKTTASPDHVVTVITNLGFQEGNDLPSRIGPMLENLTRPGDLVLAEMQVAVIGSDGENAVEDTILQFYQHPEMRRQSALVGQHLDKTSLTRLAAAISSSENETSSANPYTVKASHSRDYVFNLVPLDTEVGSVKVATTLYAVTVHGEQKYLLMNSCLKYTRDQFKAARELSGAFKVRSVYETGDKSVIFQIAERQ